MPTVPIIAPAIIDLMDDEEYTHLNKLLLRNPSLFNLLDGSAISIPYLQQCKPPVGFTIAKQAAQDSSLFSIARTIEKSLYR